MQVWVLLSPESCKLPTASNPMFDAKFVDAQHQTEIVRSAALAWKLVELTGIEPVASWLQTRRSPS
jgi:hypothetical protein